MVILQYSNFGSILTIGAMIGAIVNGQIADYIGRRGVSTSPCLESLLVVLLRFKLHNSPVFQFVGCFARKTMGFSKIFCLARWLAKAFSKVLNPISLFYAVPNLNVNVTCMTTPTFYLKRCLHKDNGKH